jgi:O-antigen ligase
MTAATYQARPYQPPSYAGGLADQASPFERFGFNVLLVFLFLAFSRIFDVRFGTLHITGISYRVILAMVLLSRGFITALKTPIGKALTGLTVCMAASLPFSVWRGGSIPFFRDSWLLYSFAAFLAVAGLIGNYEQFRKALNAIAWALFVFSIIANVFGDSDNGRLFLEQGKFANPNEMAQALLIGLPLWGGRFARSDSLQEKLFALLVMLLALVTTFRTGSRGALIAFVAMCLVYFLRAQIHDKLTFIIGGTLVVGVLVGTMPGRLVARYKTTVDYDADSAEADVGLNESAVTSSESRKILLRHSLILTIRHPLFGVGPGMFVVADDKYSKSIGLRKGQWLGTHNSYTQVSSELGIPALLFFVAAIVMALKGPYSLYKRTRGDPRLADMGSVALSLHYCMIIYAVTILFEHIAYTQMLPVLGGLSAALMRTVDAEIRRIQAAPLAVTMAPPMFHQYLRSRAVQSRQTW